MAFDEPLDAPGMQDGGEPNALAGVTLAPEVEQEPEESQFDRLRRWSDQRRTPNIADELEDDELSRIGQDCLEGYSIDQASRDEWMKKSEDAMRLAMQVSEEKSYPWPKASNIVYPLMTTAAIQFWARAYPAIVPSRNVVKGIVWGDDKGVEAKNQDGTPQVALNQQGQRIPAFTVPPGDKQRRADRIGEHMSYQLLEEQAEWEDETSKLILILPIVGCAFRKTYFDPACGRNMSLTVRAENLVVNFNAKSLELAPRITEELKLYPREVEEQKLAETFLDIDYAANAAGSSDKDAPIDFLEQHCFLDLDDDGYTEPYVVTLQKDTGKVARIVARYDADSIKLRGEKLAKIEPVQYYTKFDFLPNPDGGIYGIGLGQLLSPINAGVNTTLNMLIDQGHRATVGGGFVGRGLSMHSGSVRFRPGEYKVVNSPGSAIRDAIVDLNIRDPSTVLFQLLGLLIEAGREVAAVKDVLSGDLTAQTMQPTTLLAIIEQGLKTFTAIYKAIHRGLKGEFDKLYRLNRVYLDEITGYRQGNVYKEITREDYAKGSGVEPISDPGQVSDMQQLVRAQFLEGYRQDPLINQIELRNRIFKAANIPEADKLVVQQMPQPGKDPLVLQIEASQQVEAAKLAQDKPKVEAEAAAKLAERIRNISQAILNMANADKVISEDHRAWVAQQWEILQGIAAAAVGDAGEEEVSALPAPADMAALAAAPGGMPLPGAPA